MNTSSTPRRTRLRFLTPDEDVDPTAGPEGRGDAREDFPGAEGSEGFGDTEGSEAAEEATAGGTGYVALPGRDPVDLESLSDLLLD